MKPIILSLLLFSTQLALANVYKTYDISNIQFLRTGVSSGGSQYFTIRADIPQIGTGNTPKDIQFSYDNSTSFNYRDVVNQCINALRSVAESPKSNSRVRLGFYATDNNALKEYPTMHLLSATPIANSSWGYLYCEQVSIY